MMCSTKKDNNCKGGRNLLLVYKKRSQLKDGQPGDVSNYGNKKIIMKRAPGFI